MENFQIEVNFEMPLDDLISDLQAMVDSKDREDFSEKALEFAKCPYHYGSFSSDDPGYRRHFEDSPCGDRLILYCIIHENRITRISFEVIGCIANVMTASQMVQLAEEKTILQAKQITVNDILTQLGKFPSENAHCAALAIKTLQNTLNSYEE
jgi:nitrogen fixation NifU-like protein